jgi:hypothetical protein
MAHLALHQQSWRGPRLIDDETVAKMGHAVVVVWIDVGHPSPLKTRAVVE